MSFEIGQIFENEYPPEAAAQCNQSGLAFIQEIVSTDGIRRFQIVESTPSSAELQQLLQAKANRAAAVNSIIIEVDQMLFDGDEQSQNRINRVISSATNDADVVKWVLADNTVANVTIQQLKQVLQLATSKQSELQIEPYIK